VLLGRPAHLAVDHAVGGEVLDELACDAAQPVGGLHDRRRQVERLQVLDERAGVALVLEPVGEVVGVISGTSTPISSASSMIVCGRSAPSR
jgi:hypothetical protein